MSSKIGKSKVDISKSTLNKMKTNIESKKIESKKEEVKNDICKAARYLNTKQSAIDAINKGIKVFILSEENSGKIKYRPYTECSRPCYADNDFCWKHSTTPNTLNYVKDIVNNVNSKIAKLEHFQPNNKRKLVKNELISKLQSNDLSNKPILRIKVTEDFIKEIEHILKTNPIFMNESKNIKKISNLKDDLKKSKTSSKVNIENDDEENINDDEENIDDKENENDEENVDDDEDEENINDDEENVDNEDVIIPCDNEENEDIDDDDDEELDVSEIYTKCGKLLYLSAKDSTIYSPDGDGGGEILGKLMRVSTKEAPYHDNNKYYIVGDEIIFSDKKYIICKITNMVFSDSKAGNSILKKIGNYDFENKKIIFS
jgi:hypothetical protein